MKNKQINSFRNVVKNLKRLPFALFIVSYVLTMMCLMDLVQLGRLNDTIHPDVEVIELLYLFGYAAATSFFWKWTFAN